MAPARSGCLAALLAAFAASARAEAPRAHHWPRGRGLPGQSMLTEETLPKDFASTFAWKFHHPWGRFSAVVRGSPLIDSERNVLVSTQHGLFKLDPDGQLLWSYRAPSFQCMNVAPCLLDDSVFGATEDSVIYALDLQTGKERWRIKPAFLGGIDTHHVSAHQGVLLAAVDGAIPVGTFALANKRLLGLNASNGDLLWQLELEVAIVNFNPEYSGDGSFVFSDLTGSIHRVMLHTGKRVWSVPAPNSVDSLQENAISVSPDGSTVFACTNDVTDDGSEAGNLHAYRVSDGKRIWEKLLTNNCASLAVIAKNSDWGVQPIGQSLMRKPVYMELPGWIPEKVKRAVHRLCLWLGPWLGPILRSLPGLESFIPSTQASLVAFDTKTGATRWTFRAPDWERMAGKGDDEGLLARIESTIIPPLCSPGPWGAPALSGDETLYIGHMSGILYAIRDENGDGHIDSKTEVSTFDMDAAPLSATPAWAPGMMAMASCDSLFVFKT